MSLFICSQCQCIENTALGSYWGRVSIDRKPPLCSECDTGFWHYRFTKTKATIENIIEHRVEIYSYFRESEKVTAALIEKIVPLGVTTKKRLKKMSERQLMRFYIEKVTNA